MILTPDGKVKISINVPEKVIQQIDDDRKKPKVSRSSWLTMAAMDRLTKIREEETERRYLAGEFDKEFSLPD